MSFDVKWQEERAETGVWRDGSSHLNQSTTDPTLAVIPKLEELYPQTTQIDADSISRVKTTPPIIIAILEFAF